MLCLVLKVYYLPIELSGTIKWGMIVAVYSHKIYQNISFSEMYSPKLPGLHTAWA